MDLEAIAIVKFEERKIVKVLELDSASLAP